MDSAKRPNQCEEGARVRRHRFRASGYGFSRPRVWGPEDLNAKKTDYVSLFGAITQILASTIAIIVVLRR